MTAQSNHDQSSAFLCNWSQAEAPGAPEADPGADLDLLAAPLLEIGRLLPFLQRLLADA